jgi:hypothetical protein
MESQLPKNGRLTMTISTELTKEKANQIHAAMVAGDMTELGRVLDSSSKEWTDLMIIGDSSKGLATDAPLLSIIVADEKIQQNVPRERGPQQQIRR